MNIVSTLDDVMYYFADSPTVLTGLPNDPNCSIAPTDDGKIIAILISNHIYFHCQKVNIHFLVFTCFSDVYSHRQISA